MLNIVRTQRFSTFFNLCFKRVTTPGMVLAQLTVNLVKPSEFKGTLCIEGFTARFEPRSTCLNNVRLSFQTEKRS